MGCDLGGSGCRVCPGMWIAGAMLVGMLLQSLFNRVSTSSEKSDRPDATQSADPEATGQANGLTSPRNE